MKVAAALGLLLTLAPALAPAEPESAASDRSRLAAATRLGANTAGAASAPALEPPNDLSDLQAWLDYQRHAHLASLPDESRLFYRRGLIAKRAGQDQEAIRLVRGATELDLSFVRPHLTLASWFFTRDPSQALLRYAVVIDLVRRDFLLQLELLANLVFFTIHGFFVGLLATSLLIVLLRQAELRHIFEERLRRLVSPVGARVWTWALLIAPFAAGVGVALPVVVWMGVLWPLLRARERAVHVALLLALLAAPFSGYLIGRLAVPLREDREPLFGIVTLQNEAWSPARQASLQRLATEHPDNPFVLFGLGWSTRQSQDLATAETAYRRALVLWPADARVLNNLANVLAVQGRLDPAIELYRRAIAADPACAAAHFNLSQAYTRQFEYRAASEAAARASALDFELVRTHQALSTEDGVLPLADEWIAPARFWRTVLDSDAAARTEPVLPIVWRGHIETSGVPFAGAVILLGLGSLMVGIRWQRAMPLRPCHNCDRVVCRRCAQRSRELALCAACAEQESHAESPEFGRVLLARQRARMERGRRLMRTTLAALLPGYGLLAFQRVFQGMFLIACAAQLAAPWFGITAPFACQTGLGLAEGITSPIVALGAWIAVYAASLLGYFSAAGRAAARAAALVAPVRSRPSSVTRARAKAA